LHLRRLTSKPPTDAQALSNTGNYDEGNMDLSIRQIT
jgi:hypothetical protein